MGARISFIGDIAFVGKYKKLYENGENPFVHITEELEKSDLVIGNLEALSKGRLGENTLKNPRLKVNPKTLNYLKDIKVNIVSLAHNHAYDNLRDGFEITTGFLNENNIQYLGAGLSTDESSEPLIVNINNISFGFLNYVTQDTNPNLPVDADVFLNFFSIEKAIEDIESLNNKVDFTILLLHWGGRTEGGCYPDWEQPQIARKLVETGADLIVGHHSHTFQPYEEVDSKAVFYSIGNFCFDNYISDGELKKLDWRKRLDSAIIHVDFEKNRKYIFIISPIRNESLNIVKNARFKSKIQQRNIVFKFLNRVYILWLLYYLYIKKIDKKLFYLLRNDVLLKDKLLKIFKHPFKTSQ